MDVVKVSLKDQVYEYIKERILTGEYRPGEKINVENLTKVLDVSNSPIREAINILIKDGLVVKDKNIIRAVKLTDEDINDIKEAIVVLLTGGYKLCLKKNKIEELVENMKKDIHEQELSIIEGDEVKFLKYSIRFDVNLIICTGNMKLINIINILNDLFTLEVLGFQNSWDRRHQSLSEHKLILKCVESGNPLEVEKIINKHYGMDLISNE